MPYDEDLANRIRERLAGEDGVTERRMFGGLGFMVGGHMVVAASHDGGLLARVDPDGEAAKLPHASPMEMRGRSMAGWVRVVPEGVAGDAELAAWVDRSLAFVRTLPPK